MQDRMTKAEIIQNLQGMRAAWEALMAEVGQGRMTVPGAAGKWRVQDIIGHITWGEREVATLLQSHSFDAASPLWNKTLEERNEAVFQANVNRPFNEVLAEELCAYQDLLQALQSASEEDLNDPALYPAMPPTWRPWQLVVGNSYRHYLEHSQSIRAWLDGFRQKGT